MQPSNVYIQQSIMRQELSICSLPYFTALPYFLCSASAFGAVLHCGPTYSSYRGFQTLEPFNCSENLGSPLPMSGRLTEEKSVLVGGQAFI